MNRKDVLIGAVVGVILLVAGLWVGLSIGGSKSNSLGLIASKWTNFAGSGVTTKVGYAFTSSDNTTTTQVLSYVSAANLLQVGGTASATTVAFPGTVLLNDLIQGANGWSLTFSTSTTITPTQFCGATSILYTGTSALSTTTLPAATSTFAACNAVLGGFSTELIANESTNTVNFVAGPNTTFRCETQGIGTDTYAGGVQCTSSQVSINATSTAWSTGYWTSSSSLFILWGNQYH